jgi:protease I
MRRELDGFKVAILVADGFEQVEMTGPREALVDAGAKVEIVSPAENEVKGWKHTEWGDKFHVDVSLAKADAANYGALLLPGGVMNPDVLRRNPMALALVKAFFDTGKPVASICHGPWTLIDAGVAKGRQMTSYHSIQTDLKNAGVRWVDQEVVVDWGLVTSRHPDDIPAFNRKMVDTFAESRQQKPVAG